MGPILWGGGRTKDGHSLFQSDQGIFLEAYCRFSRFEQMRYLGYIEDYDEDVDAEDADYDGDDGVYDDDEHDFVLLIGLKCRSRINFFVVDLFE